MGKYVDNRPSELGRMGRLLEDAQKELIQLLRERERLEWRIRELQTDITHLAGICRVKVDDPLKQLGITDAIRWVLSMTKTAMSAPDIKKALAASGFDVSGYTNLLASIHTILTRLVESNEVEVQVGLTPGAHSYKWAGGLPTIPPATKRIERREIP